MAAAVQDGNIHVDAGVYALRCPKSSSTRLHGAATASRAKALLDALGLEYDEISLDDDPSFRQRVHDLGRQWTVPLVVIDGEAIGGYDELSALNRSGALSERFAA